jgi:hypothetical protein
MVGRSKNECNGREAQGWKKNELIVKTCFPLLSEVVCVFEVLECTKTWMQRVWFKNYIE